MVAAPAISPAPISPAAVALASPALVDHPRRLCPAWTPSDPFTHTLAKLWMHATSPRRARSCVRPTRTCLPRAPRSSWTAPPHRADAHTMPRPHRQDAPEWPAVRFTPHSRCKTPRSSPPSTPLASCCRPARHRHVRPKQDRATHRTPRHHGTPRPSPLPHIATRPTPAHDHHPMVGGNQSGSLSRAPCIEMAARPQPTSWTTAPSVTTVARQQRQIATRTASTAAIKAATRTATLPVDNCRKVRADTSPATTHASCRQHQAAPPHTSPAHPTSPCCDAYQPPSRRPPP